MGAVFCDCKVFLVMAVVLGSVFCDCKVFLVMAVMCWALCFVIVECFW